MNVLKTHHFEKVPGEQAQRLVRVTPYVRLSEGGRAVYLKGGKVLFEDGTVVPDKLRPDWLDRAIADMNPVARAEVGFAQPGDVPARNRKPTVAELRAALEQAEREEAETTKADAGSNGAGNPGGNGAHPPKKGKAPKDMNKQELLSAIKEKWAFDGPTDFTNAQLRELLEKGPEIDPAPGT